MNHYLGGLILLKRVLLLIIACILLLPNTVMAHSKLQSSSPAADSIVNTVPAQIEMTFNTEIESISNFKLFNAAGEQIETGKASVSGSVMTGALPPDLANGQYTVKWTIIGADSHSVEGEFAFTIDAPVATTSPENDDTTNNAENSDTAEPSPTPSPSPSPAPSPAEDGQDSAKDEGASLMPLLIIAGIIVVAAVLFTVLRRRKS